MLMLLKNLHMAVGLDQARLAQLKTTELKGGVLSTGQ